MTGHAVWSLACIAALAAEYVWLRPSARQHLHRVLYAPLRRRAHSLRRSLDALDRATNFRLYHPRHPRRTP